MARSLARQVVEALILATRAPITSREDFLDGRLCQTSDSKSPPWVVSHSFFWTERRSGGMVKVARASRRSDQAGKTTKLVKVAI